MTVPRVLNTTILWNGEWRKVGLDMMFMVTSYAPDQEVDFPDPISAAEELYAKEVEAALKQGFDPLGGEIDFPD